MGKAIIQLWNGMEALRRKGRHDGECELLEQLTARNGEKLERVLSEDAKELFEKYRDCVNEREMYSNEQAFYEGFCLGVRLTAESFLRE